MTMACGAWTIYVYDRNGPAPGNMRVKCQKPAGHTGAHYCLLPGGGVSWPLPAVES